jgi:hypothetical protein
MRVHWYDSVGKSFSVERAVASVKASFSNEKDDLERKMKRVARWEKRLNQLKNPQMTTNVQALLTQFQELCTKHNIAWQVNKDNWQSNVPAKYVKEDVSLDLYLDLNVNPDKLWANFYSVKNNMLALRIYIGKEIRVTDRILACILKG